MRTTPEKAGQAVSDEMCSLIEARQVRNALIVGVRLRMRELEEGLDREASIAWLDSVANLVGDIPAEDPKTAAWNAEKARRRRL